MPYRKYLFLLCVVTILNEGFAQNHYEMNAQGFYSNNEKNTFWAQANQLGIVPDKTLSGLAYFTLNSDCEQNSLHSSSKAVQWGYGLSGAAAMTNTKTHFYLPIAHLKAKIGDLEFKIGRFQQQTGLSGDLNLTSGAFSTSTNALPVPGISVGITEFKPLQFTNNKISIKGFYAENYAGDNYVRYKYLGEINNTMLHRKMLALKVGTLTDRINVILSGNHQVIWGGNLVRPASDMLTSSLGTYKSAVLGQSASNLFIGDHIGSVDVGVEYKDYGWIYFLYRQNFFEGNGVNRGINWQDGLYGLEIRRFNTRPTTAFHLTKIVVEVINTTNQIDYSDGYELHNAAHAISYYNQTFYRNGWAYKGRTIGNPLLANKALMKKELLVDDSDYLSDNNRVLALHTGLQGMLYQIPWTFKATYSLNSGTYEYPFEQKLHQFSFILNTEIPVNLLGNTKLTAGISGDIGELYDRTFCVSIGLRKRGIF